MYQPKCKTTLLQVDFEELKGSEIKPSTLAEQRNSDIDKRSIGENDSGCIITEPGRKYADLKKEYLGRKFDDLNFFLSPDTILRNEMKKVEWKRPSEITKSPQFIVDEATRFDVRQRSLGDCWFVAAVANLTMNKKLFDLVVPQDQSFTPGNYAGIFHFRFWQYGWWEDVYVDDRLPTVDNELIYLHSSNPKEFWSPLLEKAYAKLYGGYQNLEGGRINEATEDLCGGLSEFYSLTNCPMIYDIMYKSYERSSFLGGSIMRRPKPEILPNGLITPHVYSITNFATVSLNNSDVKLIRLRNPWGGDAKWNGAWREGSEEWKKVSEEKRKELLPKPDDGEFWMDFSDFRECFTYVEICYLNPSSFNNSDPKCWHAWRIDGSWEQSNTAVGDTVTKEHFIWIKPNVPNAKYALVIALMQKNKRVPNADNSSIGLDIWPVDTSDRKLNSIFPQSEKPKAFRLRQLTARVTLPAGRYCIIPSADATNQKASYLLRIYSETKLWGYAATSTSRKRTRDGK